MLTGECVVEVMKVLMINMVMHDSPVLSSIKLDWSRALALDAF